MLKHLAAATVLFAASLALAQPLTTAFTFQGELNSAGSPTSGTYDFRFTLYDLPLGGVQVGPQLCSNNVAVTGGKLTVQLDFGAQFAGNQRFLEVQVRQDTGLSCSTGTGFTTLAPRQSLSAAPNAIFSLNAAAAATSTNATQLNGQPASFFQNAANLNSGSIPNAVLTGSYSNILNLTNTSNTFAGSGAGLTGLNASSLVSGVIDSARLPVPLALTGAAPTSLVSSTNSAPDAGAAAFSGRITTLTGYSNAVFGQNDSANGNGVYGLAAATSGNASGVYGHSNSPAGFGGYFSGPGKAIMAESTNSDALQVQTPGAGSSCIVALHTGPNDGYGLYGQTNGTTGAGVFGRTYSSTGTTLGGLFTNYSSSGIGAAGYAYAGSGQTNGLYGESSSTSGTGVRGIATAGSGVTNGVYAQSSSPDGAAMRAMSLSTTGIAYGLYAQSNSANGYAVFGQATGTTSNCYGGYFDSRSQAGVGAYGSNSSSTGAGTGVVGAASGPSGTGVQGYALASSGLNYGGAFQSFSPSGRGVYGIASSATGTVYGVLGQATTNGWAVFAQGNMGASGLKPFRIDHPADPENKYLLHYAAESPEVINFYRGKITLDEQGQATVDLPSYFARINKSPTYQLTAFGSPMPLLHVSQGIDEAALDSAASAAPGDQVPTCTFTISGGTPNGTVCWRVEAVRNDRWAKVHGAPVELEKQGLEKGTYQQPELYAQPAEKSMTYSPASHATTAPALPHAAIVPGR